MNKDLKIMNEELLDNFLNKESLVRKKIFKILKESESLENIHKEFRNLEKHFVIKNDSVFNYKVETLGSTREYLCELCVCKDKSIQKMALICYDKFCNIKLWETYDFIPNPYETIKGDNNE